VNFQPDQLELDGASDCLVQEQPAPVVVEADVQAVLYAHLHFDGRVLLGQRFDGLHHEVLLLYDVAGQARALDCDADEVAQLDVVAVVRLVGAVERGKLKPVFGGRRQIALFAQRAVNLQAPCEGAARGKGRQAPCEGAARSKGQRELPCSARAPSSRSTFRCAQRAGTSCRCALPSSCRPCTRGGCQQVETGKPGGDARRNTTPLQCSAETVTLVRRQSFQRRCPAERGCEDEREQQEQFKVQTTNETHGARKNAKLPAALFALHRAFQPRFLVVKGKIDGRSVLERVLHAAEEALGF
jgi:hypothetical protein